jgi:cytochrome P450
MIVTESMRLYPPAYGIGREAARPTEVAGHSLAAGGIVIIPTWVGASRRSLVRRA